MTTADTCTVALTVPRLCCGFAPNATGGPYLSVADKPARWSINVLRARRFVQNSTCRIAATLGANGAALLKVCTFRLAVPWHCALAVSSCNALRSFHLRTFLWARSRKV